MGFWRRRFDDDRVDEVVAAVLRHAGEEDEDAAWTAAQPLVEAHDRPRAARALARLVARGAFDPERGLEAARLLHAAHGEDVEVLAALGDAFESLHDMRDLNGPPPADPWFAAVAEQMCELAGQATDPAQRLAAFDGLATAARVLGRTWDSVAEHACEQAIQLAPEDWRHHYALGLFYKTRGRFPEGQAANQRAYDLGGADRDAVQWNLGICATGAGDGRTALRIWAGLGHELQIGRFDLPEGGYRHTKVRLAERPIAERDPGRQPDDPGDEETIWVERLSPCHGIVRSALYSDDIGVDYGDVVLFDGAPITYHTYGEDKVPVFPHLATLRRPGYQIFRFAGTQQREKQIAELSEGLPGDAVLYVHTEQFVVLCANCWNDPDVDHAVHRTDEHRVVAGKLCAPPTMAPREVMAALDGVLGAVPEVRVYVPDLVAAAGDSQRADVERRRMAMLEES